MRRLFLALLVILTLGVGANAQTFRGAINGTVTDPSGSSVPNAQVKATESTTGIDHTTVTTTDGAFSFRCVFFPRHSARHVQSERSGARFSDPYGGQG